MHRINGFNKSEFNKPLSLVLGFFDGVHLGHIELIKRALKHTKKRDTISCVLTFDEHPENVISSGIVTPSITSNEVKAEIFDALGLDMMLMLKFREVKDISPSDFMYKLCELNPLYIVCGYDYRFGKGAVADTGELKKLCDSRGIKCEIIPPVTFDGKTVSSSHIRELIRLGDVCEANRLMFRPYCVYTEVEYGRSLGRNLGIPTINQYIDEDCITPYYGVYLSRTYIGNNMYSSVTNIGIKPTVGGKNPMAETHIFDYTGDLYGEKVRVDILKLIRDEKRFESVEALKLQMKSDIDIAKSLQSKFGF